MGLLEAIALTALLTSLAMTAETFRTRPMWPRMTAARPGQSPRQRRWQFGGLALLMAGQLVALQLAGDTALWALSFALVGAGFVCVLAGIFRGPTDAERQWRAQVLGTGGHDAA